MIDSIQSSKCPTRMCIPVDLMRSREGRQFRRSRSGFKGQLSLAPQRLPLASWIIRWVWMSDTAQPKHPWRGLHVAVFLPVHVAAFPSVLVGSTYCCNDSAVAVCCSSICPPEGAVHGPRFRHSLCGGQKHAHAGSAASFCCIIVEKQQIT